MRMNREAIGITGLTLIIVGIIGIIFVSPEPVKLVERADGMLTAIPRIPWAAGFVLLIMATGVGLVVASVVGSVLMRWKAKRR